MPSLPIGTVFEENLGVLQVVMIDPKVFRDLSHSHEAPVEVLVEHCYIRCSRIVDVAPLLSNHDVNAA